MVILTLLAMMVIVCLEGGNVMEMLTVKMLQTKAQKCVVSIIKFELNVIKI